MTNAKIKRIWEKYKKEIIALSTAGLAIGGCYAYLQYVKCNTRDLEKPIISGVNVLQFYEQFGDRTMWAEMPVVAIDEFGKNISDLFAPDATVCVEVFENLTK